MSKILINPTFTYKPYPYAVLDNVFEEGVAHKLVATYPSLDLFKKMDSLGEKYSLSEVNNPKNYYDFLKQSDIWTSVYNDVKSGDFLYRVLSALKSNHVNPLLDSYLPYKLVGWRGIVKQLKKRQLPRNAKARFEFSSMPANGGYILPHTDAVTKVITLVIYMNEEGGWDPIYGGGTSVCEPINDQYIFNLGNEYFKFDQVHEVNNIPLKYNSGTLFVKTFNSWHCVFPMTGPKNLFRKTLTINIEVL